MMFFTIIFSLCLYTLCGLYTTVDLQANVNMSIRLTGYFSNLLQTPVRLPLRVGISLVLGDELETIRDGTQQHFTETNETVRVAGWITETNDLLVYEHSLLQLNRC